MTAPSGRRATDRTGVALQDRERWDESRRRDRRRRLWVIAAFGVGLIAIALQIRSNVLDGRESDRRDRAQATATARAEKRERDRDTARLYQSCQQRAKATAAQNNTNRIFRSALLTSHNRMRLQASRTTDPVLAARYRANAVRFLEDRASVTFAVVPDCRGTYPDWRRLSRAYPGIVRTLPRQSGKSGPTRPDRPDPKESS